MSLLATAVLMLTATGAPQEPPAAAAPEPRGAAAVPAPATPTAPATAPAAAARGVVDLTPRGMRKWKLKLPDEQWTPVGTAFRLKKTHGADFATRLEGTRLSVDTDGDGTTDVTLEGKTAFVTLRGKSATGAPLAYPVRLKNEQGWKFAPGGYLDGKVAGTRIRLIDQNNNGVFGDLGRDAMIVGSGRVATFFSAAVDLGGKLCAIDVDPSGTRLSFAPYDGPAGKLHLSCSTKGKVLAAVVRSVDFRFSFDMARAADGMLVPVGGYRLVKGELGLGGSRVTMRTGKSEAITVAKDQTKQVCWGGPVRAEFDYQRQAGKVHLAPDRVWLYGAAGELYTDWVPLGASPEFTITEEDTGKEVAQAHFPGTC